MCVHVVVVVNTINLKQPCMHVYMRVCVRVCVCSPGHNSNPTSWAGGQVGSQHMHRLDHGAKVLWTRNSMFKYSVDHGAT